VSLQDRDVSQAYLAAIVESSDDAIISKDLDGIVRTINPAGERLFGYPFADIVGQPVTLLLPFERLHEEAEILARLRRGEKVDHFETERVTRDGRRLEVSISVSPVRDGDGNIVGAAKIVRDVTERNRARRAWAAQQEWFRVTLSSIGDAVITSDPSGAVTFMNPVAERLTGWTADEAAGRPLSDVFHIVNEFSREPVENPADRAVRHGVIVGLANHTLLIARDGTEYPIADSAAPIIDDARKILGVVLVFHDVSERRRAQAALDEQRKWLETTLTSIGDGVIATDIRGQVVFMNPVAEHLTGWKTADARGRPCDTVFHIVNEMTRREVKSPVWRVLEEGAVVGLANHTVLIAPDGTERAIDDSGAPIRDASERIVGVVLVFRDVTERRRTELERVNAAAEREELLARERHARAEAERADRVKDEFVAMVSHELRTPLSAILGWTGVLREKHEDADVLRHGIEVIDRNARNQAQLVSDLLDVSRIASDKLLIEPEQIDLAHLVEESVESVQHAATQQGIALVRRVEGDVPPTVGDPGRLKQVFWNLLSNAIKFTPKGGRIEVLVRGREGDVEVVVSDTGIGIREEDLPFLFDRFRQSGATSSRRYGGLGLGLSIAQHLVRLHGGSLRATSPGEGRGATFTVELPLTPAQSPPPSPGVSALAPPKPSLDDVTVLVVEDETDMRSVLELALRDHGARVLTAATAEEAFDFLDRGGVDVLLSDIGLPDTDGYELIRRLRERDDESAQIPAIALTAFARAEDRALAMRAGFQNHVAKPFETGEVLLVVASFADLVRSRRDRSPGRPRHP